MISCTIKSVGLCIQSHMNWQLLSLVVSLCDVQKLTQLTSTVPTP